MRFSTLLSLTLPVALTLTACTTKDLFSDTGIFGGLTNDQISACGAFTEVEGANLGYGGYPDTTASAGAECVCQSELSASSPVSRYVRYTTLEGNAPQPKRVDVETPFDSPSSATPSASGSSWSTRFSHSTSVAVDIQGTYTVRQSMVDNADNPTSCADYLPTDIDLEFAPSGPPPAPVDTDGSEENAMSCEPGEPLLTRFQLVQLPETGALAPLYTSGARDFAGMEVQRVSVVNWGDLSELVVDNDAGKLVLDMGNSELEFAADSAWLWSTSFSADGQEGSLPIVEVQGHCVNQRAPMMVDDGYVTSASELAPWLDSEARVVARIVNDGREDTLATHHLMFEVEGTSSAQGFPLVEVDKDRWTLDFDGVHMTLHGEVRRDDQALYIDVNNGSALGAGDLSGSSLTLSAYK